MNKKIAVIGNTVIDFIHTKNAVIKRPGGIAYTLAALLAFKDESDSIYPLTTISGKYTDYLKDIFPKVENRFVEDSDEMAVVRLYDTEENIRIECFESFGKTFSVLPLIESGIDFDGIFVNMINGFDIVAEDLQTLKEHFACPVYIDIHTLSRGLDEKGKRYFREIPDRELWLSNADIIQSNELELNTFSEGTTEMEKAESVLKEKDKILLITKADRGAVLYKKENNELFRIFVPAVETEGENRVGCGDVFGAAFFYSYICGESIFDSLFFANATAGEITNFTDFNDYLKLKRNVDEKYY